MNGQRTDAELMAAFAGAGDDSAFAEIVRRWDAPILRFLVKATGDGEAAKDLRQDTFVRVYRYANSYDARFAFSTWLFRIATNRLHTWRARQMQIRVHEQPEPEGDRLTAVMPGLSPDREAMRNEMRSAVRQALEGLPAQERDLVLLRFQVGMNYREIAEVQGVPETTVKSRIYATLNRLREPLAGLGEADRRVEV